MQAETVAEALRSVATRTGGVRTDMAAAVPTLWRRTTREKFDERRAGPEAGRDSHPTSKGGDIQLKDIRKKLPERVLSRADWQHWKTNGYVIVRQAVSIAMKSRNIVFLRRAEVEFSGNLGPAHQCEILAG
jgi:hypothetical protein